MRRSRGLTLIECIIATFLLAVGFVAVASVFPLAYRGAVLDANHVTALQCASEVLAGVRNTPYGSVPPARVTQPMTVSTIVEGVARKTDFLPIVTFARGGQSAQIQAACDVAIVTVRWTEGTGGSTPAVDKSVEVRGGVFRAP